LTNDKLAKPNYFNQIENEFSEDTFDYNKVNKNQKHEAVERYNQTRDYNLDDQYQKDQNNDDQEPMPEGH